MVFSRVLNFETNLFSRMTLSCLLTVVSMGETL